MAALKAKKNSDQDGQPEKKPSMKDLYDGGVSAAATVAKEGKSAARGSYLESYRVLIKPLVTEKATKIGTENKYAFVVLKKANKIMIAKAIEHVYGVKPVRINIINRIGKIVRSRRGNGQRKDWKKAIVTLPKGKSINIYEGV